MWEEGGCDFLAWAAYIEAARRELAALQVVSYFSFQLKADR